MYYMYGYSCALTTAPLPKFFLFNPVSLFTFNQSTII